jgi:natural product precursor
MKKLNLVKLTEMSLREQKHVKGGCGCGCRWVNQGGSSSTDNACANSDNNLTSPGGPFPVKRQK